MPAREHELDRLLTEIAARLDPARCRAVDERYRRALAYEEVDRPPLVVQPAFGKVLDLPEPWSGFYRYGYREAFDDPAAMLQNMLLDRVVPGLILGDDSPLAIRNDHGTIQIGSAVGGDWMLHENNFPWIRHFDSIEPIERIANATGPVDLNAGVLPRSFATLRYYGEKLRGIVGAPRKGGISRGNTDTSAVFLCVSRTYSGLKRTADGLQTLW